MTRIKDFVAELLKERLNIEDEIKSKQYLIDCYRVHIEEIDKTLETLKVKFGQLKGNPPLAPEFEILSILGSKEV